MKWMRANEVTPISDTYFKVGGLHEDIDYEFRVAAENKAGLGPYSEVSSPVKTYVHKGQSSALSISHSLRNSLDSQLNLLQSCIQPLSEQLTHSLVDLPR